VTKPGSWQLRHAQAVASPLTPVAGRGGQLITAAAVVQDDNDSGQLLPMIEEAAANCGGSKAPGVSSCAGSRTAALRGRSLPRPSTCVSWLASGNRRRLAAVSALSDDLRPPPIHSRRTAL
jgi:hypothetical protein